MTNKNSKEEIVLQTDRKALTDISNKMCVCVCVSGRVGSRCHISPGVQSNDH